jgi:hypothetical protein
VGGRGGVAERGWRVRVRAAAAADALGGGGDGRVVLRKQ